MLEFRYFLYIVLLYFIFVTKPDYHTYLQEKQLTFEFLRCCIQVFHFFSDSTEGSSLRSDCREVLSCNASYLCDSRDILFSEGFLDYLFVWKYWDPNATEELFERLGVCVPAETIVSYFGLIGSLLSSICMNSG